MMISIQGIWAMRALRLELQEDAGESFPQSVLTELLVMRDICKRLDLNIFQCQEVLGSEGWDYVNESIDLPIGINVEYLAMDATGQRSPIEP